MGTRVDADGGEKVYNAAGKWVEAALRTDGLLLLRASQSGRERSWENSASGS